MTVKQLLKWRKDVLAEKIKYPPELIDSVVCMAQKVYQERTSIGGDENITKRNNKQKQLKRILNYVQ
jgi:hypothetical protein